jgi:5'-nucleotidase
MGCNNQPQQVLEDLNLKPVLTILHFNDVYDIQTKKGKGGICNFKAQLDHFKAIYGENTLTLFSGDAFSPSILSRNNKGWQMVKALNSLKIDAACYGNH